jgi:hypothetical protein
MNLSRRRFGALQPPPTNHLADEVWIGKFSFE